MKEKNKKVNRISKIGMVLAVLGIVLAMAGVTIAAEVGPCVIGVPSPCNGGGDGGGSIGIGVSYPKPPTPMSAVIDISDIFGGITASDAGSDPVYGTEIIPNGKVIGVYAGQEVKPDLDLPLAGNTLWFYAPTMAAPTPP